MIKSQKIQFIQDAIFRGDLKRITMSELKMYRDHFEDLYKLLNISGKQFRPSFEYAMKQFSTADDFIRARERNV
jgi:hypothetical protein